MGGKWNSKLTCGSGWIFSLTKKKELEDWLENKKNKEGITAAVASPPKVVTLKKNEDTSDSLLSKFVEYLKPHYKNNKKLMDILVDFSMLKLNRQKLDDDLDTYFSNDSIVLYTHFFTFFSQQKTASHDIYQNLDKDKFIEHGLIQLL